MAKYPLPKEKQERNEEGEVDKKIKFYRRVQVLRECFDYSNVVSPNMLHNIRFRCRNY